MMRDRQAVTTSLQVARVFNKKHKHVIEAINNKINSAENSAQYKNMFVEGTYTDASGKANKMYYMNRDGFTFIAFGFTGAKADQFKLKYIDA
ncbi:phage regulatory protein, partial [Limosilactobacillus reuteri]